MVRLKKLNVHYKNTLRWNALQGWERKCCFWDFYVWIISNGSAFIKTFSRYFRASRIIFNFALQSNFSGEAEKWRMIGTNLEFQKIWECFSLLLPLCAFLPVLIASNRSQALESWDRNNEVDTWRVRNRWIFPPLWEVLLFLSCLCKARDRLWSYSFHKGQTVFSKVVFIYRKGFWPVYQELSERDGTKLGTALNCRFRLLSLLYPCAHSRLLLFECSRCSKLTPLSKFIEKKTVTEDVKAPTERKKEDRFSSLCCNFFCVLGPCSSELSWWKMLIISSWSLETIQLTVSFHLTETVFHWNPSAIPTHFQPNTLMRCSRMWAE